MYPIDSKLDTEIRLASHRWHELPSVRGRSHNHSELSCTLVWFALDLGIEGGNSRDWNLRGYFQIYTSILQKPDLKFNMFYEGNEKVRKEGYLLTI